MRSLKELFVRSMRQLFCWGGLGFKFVPTSFFGVQVENLTQVIGELNSLPNLTPCRFPSTNRLVFIVLVLIELPSTIAPFLTVILDGSLISLFLKSVGPVIFTAAFKFTLAAVKLISAVVFEIVSPLIVISSTVSEGNVPNVIFCNTRPEVVTVVLFILSSVQSTVPDSVISTSSPYLSRHLD